MVTYCVGCAKPVPEDSKVCPYCKRDFSKPLAGPPKRVLPPTPSPKRPPFQTFREKMRPKLDAKGQPKPPTQSVTRTGPLPTSPPSAGSHWGQTLVLAAAMVGGFWALSLMRGNRASAPPEPSGAGAAAPEAPSPAPPPAPEAPASLLDEGQVQPPEPAADWEKPRRVRAPRRARAPEKPPETDNPVFVATFDPASAPDEGPSAGRECRLSGEVFDLVTLSPVYSAEVVFTDPSSGKRVATVTDSMGRYRIRLPAAQGGYDVVIRHPSYDTKYAEDGEPSLKTLGTDERRQKAWDMTRTLQHKQMLSAPAGGRVKTDFALIPLSGNY